MKKIKQFIFVLFIFSALAFSYPVSQGFAQGGGQCDSSPACNPASGTCCGQCDPGPACNPNDPNGIPCCGQHNDGAHISGNQSGGQCDSNPACNPNDPCMNMPPGPKKDECYKQHGDHHDGPNGHGESYCSAIPHPDGSKHVDPPEELLDRVAAEYEAGCRAGKCGISRATYSKLMAFGHSRREIDCHLAEGHMHNNDGQGEMKGDSVDPKHLRKNLSVVPDSRRLDRLKERRRNQKRDAGMDVGPVGKRHTPESKNDFLPPTCPGDPRCAKFSDTSMGDHHYNSDAITDTETGVEPTLDNRVNSITDQQRGYIAPNTNALGQASRNSSDAVTPPMKSLRQAQRNTHDGIALSGGQHDNNENINTNGVSESNPFALTDQSLPGNQPGMQTQPKLEQLSEGNPFGVTAAPLIPGANVKTDKHGQDVQNFDLAKPHY